jgi:hypothetical protein
MLILVTSAFLISCEVSSVYVKLYHVIPGHFRLGHDMPD